MALRLLLLGILAAVACVDEDRVHVAVLSEGTYRVAYGHGYQPEDEARLLAVTARLDRAAGRLVFTMADSSEQSMIFAPRPRDQWAADCYTMSSHTLNEVADLAPAPLQLESLVFATPVVYAKCGPERMILSDEPGDEATFLAFDHE